MKNSKKKTTTLYIFLICIWSIYFVFNTDRFLHKNIKAIDRAEVITIIGEDDQKTYEFNDEMYELLSYGGMIIETDNFLERLFKPYYKELDEMDLSIVYTKDNSILETAKVYYSNEEPDEYILYLNNVYWTTMSKLDDLLDLYYEWEWIKKETDIQIEIGRWEVLVLDAIGTFSVKHHYSDLCGSVHFS